MWDTPIFENRFFAFLAILGLFSPFLAFFIFMYSVVLILNVFYYTWYVLGLTYVFHHFGLFPACVLGVIYGLVAFVFVRAVAES